MEPTFPVIGSARPTLCKINLGADPRRGGGVRLTRLKVPIPAGVDRPASVSVAGVRPPPRVDGAAKPQRAAPQLAAALGHRRLISAWSTKPRSQIGSDFFRSQRRAFFSQVQLVHEQLVFDPGGSRKVEQPTKPAREFCR